MTIAFAAERFKIAFKNMLAYKLELIVTIIRLPLTLLVAYFAWKAIFTNTGQEIIRGFTFPQMFSYYVFASIVGFLVHANVAYHLSRKIRRGKLTGQLLWPVRYMMSKLYSCAGTNTFLLITPIIPTFLLLYFLFDLSMAKGIFLLLFAAALLLGFVLTYLINFSIGTSAFWMKENRGLRILKNGIITLLAGGFMPLSLFPDATVRVLEYLPFAHMRYKIVQIIIGQLSVNEAIRVLVIQLAWILTFLVLALWLWKKGVRRYSSVGA